MLEIEQRNLELARHEPGRGSSVGDVRRAAERADHAQAHVAAARARALQALLRSAAAHEAAAERYEQLAAAGLAASAGGFQPLRALISGLPANLPAAVLVVLHIPASGGSSLPGILDRAARCPPRPR